MPRLVLPSQELDHLAFLGTLPSPAALHARVAALHARGWPLAVLARSLTPPRPKSTVQYWASASSSISFPYPAPPLPDPTPPSSPSRHSSTTPPPTVPAAERPHLAQLALQARRYRANTRATSSAALANQELTQRALAYRAQGIPTRDIADAANVSYRAMARRIASAP